MSYKVGAHKEEITVYKEDCGMLGYGRQWNYIKGIETPQFVRAFIIEQNETRIALVNVECCFITSYLKQGVLQRLQTDYPEFALSDAQLMLTAQHTHSMAGGYTQHIFYNLFVPGFDQAVFEMYRDGIVRALIKAFDKLQPATLSLREGDFAPEIPVCFNRSLRAYRQNPEVEGSPSAHLACDRTMKLLQFEDEKGTPIGSVNWFGVHATSVSSKNQRLCYDNKGYAAAYLEQHLNALHRPSRPIVTAFTQDAAGDITPNYVWDKKLKRLRGGTVDDFGNARFNGRLQFEKALELTENTGKTLQGDIDFIQTYIDFSETEVDAKYTHGEGPKFTAPPSVGMAFLEGTKEGPGASRALGHIVRVLSRCLQVGEHIVAGISPNKRYRKEIIRKYKAQHPKAIVVELSRGAIMTYKRLRHLPLPSFLDPALKYMKQVYRQGYTQRKPWGPEVLPLQLMSIGPLAIVGVPAELTTIAGARLRATLAPILAQRGIEHIMLAPYANSYSGYITTQEEYKVQAYEGGHTLYGKWTLAAYQTHFARIAEQFLQPVRRRDAGSQDPEIYAEEDIWKGFDNPKVRVWK